MAASELPSPRPRVLLYGMAYTAVVVSFLWIFSQFFIPGKGFTYLVMFGDQRNANYLPELRAIDHYEMQESYGYDAQHYAQIAMRPVLDDPELVKAVDNLPYRARRILLSWLAFGLAGGDPVLALHIFSLQNIVAWVLLAVLMLHWFPPGTLHNFVRWAGVLLSFGLCFSVRGALVDGPSLLMIAAAVFLYETGRSWWSAVVLAVAGLAKETNILGGAIFADSEIRGRKAWGRNILQGLLVLVPLCLWMVYLESSLGSGGGTGVRNFGQPLVAYFSKWLVTLDQVGEEGYSSVAKWSLLMLIALSAQLLYFVLRPQWRQPWWRVGMAYSVLMIVLGDAVWEGYPGAASRVLLPMTLAFNVLLPRGRGWLIPLIIGNLTVFTIVDVLKPPGGETYVIEGSRELRTEVSSGRSLVVHFDEQWYQPERSRFEYWRWSNGTAEITWDNPHSGNLIMDTEFQLRANDERTVRIVAGDRVLWDGAISRGESPNVRIAGYELPPGATTWRFETDKPPARPNDLDLRAVAFNVREMQIRLRAVQAVLPPEAAPESLPAPAP